MNNLRRPTRRNLLISLLPLLAGALALGLYASTAAPWLTWEHAGADGGDLITAAITGGVPHPSGYPTYCLLGRLYALLPLGSSARRLNLFSATAAALAVGLLAALIWRWLRPPAETPRPTQGRTEALIALAATLAFATSPTLWSQALIAEVYALTALFFVLALCIATHEERLARWEWWGLLGLVLGLGLGAHLTLALLLPGLAIWLWPHARRARLLVLAGGLALGLGVYAYLPLAASGNPPVNWGNPRTWEGFQWVVSGQMYRHFVLGLPLSYLPARIGAWVQLWVQQYTWPGVALAVFGLWSWLERGQRRWALATALPFALYSLYAITYDTADSYVYLIPAYVLAAIWMAEGARALLAEIAQRGGAVARWARAIGLALLVALPLVAGLARYPALDLSRDRAAADWVRAALAELPPNALLITGEDRHTFTLDYVQWVEGQRPDVILLDGELLAYPWYREQLARRYPAWAQSGIPTSLEEVVQANSSQRPVYLSSSRSSLDDLFQSIPQGPLWRVVSKDTSGPDAPQR